MKVFNPPSLPADKANHYLYGTLLTLVGSFHSVWAGVALCALFGIGREVLQRILKDGTPDPKDAIATIAGSAPILFYYLWSVR